MIVGIDGSDQSIVALQFAAGEARLRGVPARRVWVHRSRDGRVVARSGAGRCTVDRNAQDRLDNALTAVGSDLVGLEVDASVERGRAASVLLECASDDDILVVGLRGRGGFKGLLLGSVSQQVVQHASGPVVVVRTAPTT